MSETTRTNSQPGIKTGQRGDYYRVLLPNGMWLRVGTNGNGHVELESYNHEFTLTAMRNHNGRGVVALHADANDDPTRPLLHADDYVLVRVEELTEEQRRSPYYGSL